MKARLLDLPNEQEGARAGTALLAMVAKKNEAQRMARSGDRAVSLQGQVILARDYNLVMPMRLQRLPVEARSAVTDILPVSPVRPKVCLRCGGKVNEQGECISNHFILQKVGMYRKEVRCKAVWRV